MKELLEIRWPDHYKPQNCPVHVRNDLDMVARPEHVWAWLICAPLWPSWYINSANVTILEGSEHHLENGTQFRWKTFGVTIISTVVEYVPNERIAWTAHSFGLDVYHAWILSPSSRGCTVVTEETQHGWLARLAKILMPKRMSDFHQLWLEELERKACEDLPPGVKQD
jgi:hypothetical protein